MINLTKNQKLNLTLVLKESKYNHQTKNREQLFFTVDGSELNESELQAHIDNFDILTPTKNKAKTRIKNQAEKLMIGIELSYPSFERQTWPYQRLECEAYELDNSALTPTIDAIALSRGVSRESQLTRTIAKTTEFKNTSNHLAGKRQYFEDLIDNSDDIDYINAINFEA